MLAKRHAVSTTSLRDTPRKNHFNSTFPIQPKSSVEDRAGNTRLCASWMLASDHKKKKKKIGKNERKGGEKGECFWKAGEAGGEGSAARSPAAARGEAAAPVPVRGEPGPGGLGGTKSPAGSRRRGCMHLPARARRLSPYLKADVVFKWRGGDVGLESTFPS